MIPSPRPKLFDLYTLSQSKLIENHTLHSGTYLYNPYVAVAPPLGKKGWQMHCKNLGECPGYVVYSYFKDSEFTAVKRMQNSKLGMWEGYHLSVEVYGGTLSVKNGIWE